VEFHFVARNAGADVRLPPQDVDITTDEFSSGMHCLSLKILSEARPDRGTFFTLDRTKVPVAGNERLEGEAPLKCNQVHAARKWRNSSKPEGVAFRAAEIDACKAPVGA
jgi:hypothetical protein